MTGEYMAVFVRTALVVWLIAVHCLAALGAIVVYRMARQL